MEKKETKIKDDINFLEYPNWLVNEKEALKTYKIEKPNGIYVISTTEDIDRLPDRTDKIMLYYLISYLMKDDFKSRIVKTSRYRIAKDVFGTFRYERIMISLQRWHNISISFKGSFYDGDRYSTRFFHVLDDVILQEKELKIYFNQQFIDQLRETNYFKLINFDEYKKLRKPSSARLYEILIKTFKDRNEWEIGIIKLGEKITFSEKYPSQILRKIETAVKEINKETDLNIKFEYNKKTQICTFYKVKKDEIVEPDDEPTTNLPKDTDFESIIALIPKDHQDKKTILEAVAKAYKKHGFDYLSRNIRYTNRNCKGNYRAYLNKALKEDWGLALKEDEEAKQKIIDKQQEQKRQEREALDRQKKMRCKVQDYIKNLSFENLELIREEAMGRLDEKMKKYAEEYGTYDTIVEITMNQIVQERLAAAR